MTIINDLKEYNYHYINYKNGKVWDYYGSNYMWVDENSTDDKIVVHIRQSKEFKGKWTFNKQEDGNYKCEEYGYTKTYCFYDADIQSYSTVPFKQIKLALKMESQRQYAKYLESFHPWSDANFEMKVSYESPLKEVEA